MEAGRRDYGVGPGDDYDVERIVKILRRNRRKREKNLFRLLLFCDAERL